MIEELIAEIRTMPTADLIRRMQSEHEQWQIEFHARAEADGAALRAKYAAILAHA